MNIGEAIGRYVELRDKKAEVQKRHQEELVPYNTAINRLDIYFLEQLNQQGVDRIAGPGGTIYKSTRSSATVADWEALLSQIKEEDLWHLLEHRVSKKASEEFANETGSPPAGVTMSYSATVGVRRS